NWIIINSGTYKGAKAEITAYFDSTHVQVHGMGWDGDIASCSFSIFPEPSFVAGDGKHLAVHVGTTGHMHVHAKSFSGEADICAVLEVEVESNADNINGFCIDYEANGKNHNDAIYAAYNTGALVAGDTNHVIHINIDESEASAADATTDIDALLIETTDVSSANKEAVHVGPGFTNALKVVGTPPEDPDVGYECTAAHAVTDRVAGAGANAAFIDADTDVQILDAVNDYILVGHTTKEFEIIACNFAIPASHSCNLTFYYSDG
ncbi:unnamed protein product, partial [marine sediment metagenome]